MATSRKKKVSKNKKAVGSVKKTEKYKNLQHAEILERIEQLLEVNKFTHTLLRHHYKDVQKLLGS